MKKTLTALVLTVGALLGVGIVVLASASTLQALKHYNDPYGFFIRQSFWLVGSLVVLFLCSRFDYHLWKKYLLFPSAFYVLIVLLLVLTLCPGIRKEINGSYRWLPLIGSFRIQPGEFAKLAIVVVFAVWMDHIGWRVKQFGRGVVVPGVLLGVFALLMYLEKDLGATMVVGVLGISLMFIAGIRLLYLLPFATVALSLGTWWVMRDPHRLGRIKAWWAFVVDPTSAATTNHQLYQSIVAFMSGGPYGVGFNQSLQKYWYLPEAHTDFIFAIGGEELGFAFSGGVLVAYAVLLTCGMLISIHAPDRLGRLLAFGMTLLLVFQAAFNIGVVTGCLPTKGLALPFISYGGTNLLTALFAVGTLFNVGMHIGVQDEQMHIPVVRDAVSTV